MKLEGCVFKNNAPDLLDAFSGGRFFSDAPRRVWNNPNATFITTGTLPQADVAGLRFLNASDPFLAGQQARSRLTDVQLGTMELDKGPY